MTDIRAAGTIALGHPAKPELDSAKSCIGERVLSLRQLLMRHVVVYLTAAAQGQLGYNIRAGTVGYTTQTGGTTKVIGDFAFDLYSAFVACYVFKRGGVRLLMYTPTAASLVTVHQAQLTTAVAPVTTYAPASGANLTGAGTGTFVLPAATSNTVILKDSQYQALPSQLVRYGSATTPEPNDYYAAQNVLIVHSPTSFNLQFWRSVDEDFQVGYFVGPPTYTTSANA